MKPENKKYKISDLSPHLFWDVEKEKIDPERNASFIIERVLSYGLLKDWIIIRHVYGLDKIQETALNIRSLDKVTLAFLCSLFSLNKTKFRCYKEAQLNPTPWNS